MGTEYVAVAFTILFTIATSVLLGRYMFQRVHRGAHAARSGASCRSNGWCCA